MSKTYKDCKWIAFRRGNPCPICGGTDQRCSLYAKNTGEPILYRCKYVTSSHPSGDGWYNHLASEVDGTNIDKERIKRIIRDYKQVTITEEDRKLWSKVYKRMREAFFILKGVYLYPEHLENLLSRGLTEDQVKEMEFFSVPKDEKIRYQGYEVKLKTAIIKILLKYFKEEELIKVPGFYKATHNDSDYVALKNTIYDNKRKDYVVIDGYFIPYHDYEGQIIGMQFRMLRPVYDKKMKPMRYIWFSSKSSCGSPIDYFVPNEIKKDDVILVTEGALKGKISGSYLGVRVLAEAGVANYRSLIKTLQEIQEKEKKKFKVLLALDMDKYSNPDVMNAEISTVTLLKATGVSTTILEWDISEGKGIDDKLQNSLRGLRYLQF
ncbi:MAG: DUF3854 domain-containing protein [Clostridium paraputrificum]|uniref:DUF3854 domain-containing protein n=1 Tax=Clostridium sp. TaxID=1506 RepID=UPI0025C3DADC|nr:DUF3854 domain-containing protein [Clostridium sp.]MBS5926238.1 DUF3854 domain-containing protein [Clostridium sp.]